METSKLIPQDIADELKRYVHEKRHGFEHRGNFYVEVSWLSSRTLTYLRGNEESGRIERLSKQDLREREVPVGVVRHGRASFYMINKEILV